MKEIEEFLKYSELFSIYKDLFSAKQQKYMSAFFEEDNSFTEISNALNISRQAVFENIKRSCTKLDEYELKLGILKKEKEYISNLEKLNENFTKKYLEKIIKDLKGY
ncbi:DNA-binding protein [Oceanivirga salmonicida]|uniref:DNA-binding protein n=1 Tax=Oceanivirga salmonicida TaxID=1769291 RepID=UPI000831C40B|nr:DNA-binding protein [Oceanivirga salmonicida]